MIRWIGYFSQHRRYMIVGRVYKRVRQVHRRVHTSIIRAGRVDAPAVQPVFEQGEQVYQRLQRVYERVDRVFQRIEWVCGHRLGT